MKTNSKNDTQDVQRIQKKLAHLGYGSRREIEALLKEGLVSVNGKLAKLGDSICETDTVQLKGRTIDIAPKIADKIRVIVYHKPAGQVCSNHNQDGMPTVFSSLPKLRVGKWISVGRLDVATTGLLLFTNCGELAHRLMHPSYVLDREYAVRITPRLSEASLQKLKEGVDIGEEALVKFSDIKYFNGSGINHWYHAVLMTGKNREVRRLFETQEALVSRLKRVRFGPVLLPKQLKLGTSTDLIASDTLTLCQLVDLPMSKDAVYREKHYGKKNIKSSQSCLIPYPNLKQRKERSR